MHPYIWNTLENTCLTHFEASFVLYTYPNNTCTASRSNNPSWNLWRLRVSSVLNDSSPPTVAIQWQLRFIIFWQLACSSEHFWQLALCNVAGRVGKANLETLGDTRTREFLQDFKASEYHHHASSIVQSLANPKCSSGFNQFHKTFGITAFE